MQNEIIKEKVEQAKQILEEKDIDMWLTFVRESSVSGDLSMDMIVVGIRIAFNQDGREFTRFIQTKLNS